ncbi:hypothetical protein BC835DRAFT_1419924 [Cytidiella melzeri]|nr:hypothetical protein BC835DRAFT_1419924 [Cytidiella melzeri]
MTSELSNALNPNAAQSRSRARLHSYDVAHPSSSASHHEVGQRPLQSYVPHRSELELAITPQEQPPPPVQTSPVQNPPALRAVQNLLQVVVSQHAAEQAERRRRQAWEQELEARQAQREAELQEQLAEMRSELLLLKASVSMQQQPVQHLLSEPLPAAFQPPLPKPSAHIEEITSPVLEEPRVSLPSSLPARPTHHYTPQLPTFVEGSSSVPIPTPETMPSCLLYPPTPFDTRSPMLPSPTLTEATTDQHLLSPILPPPPRSHLPAPSPSGLSPHSSTAAQQPQASHLPSPAQSHTSPNMPATQQQPSPRAPGKRRTPPSPGSDYDSSDESDQESAGSTLGGNSRKRRNGHDHRCLTIQHAMRVHLLRCMRLRSSKDLLPASHDEHERIPAGEPVRFVWEKTVKKSPHNAAMKTRVLKELVARRTRYKHVPDKDFGKKVLDATFEQAFLTLRQKYKMQKDDTSALQYRRREDQKYMKARRRERKKTKLTQRTDRRKKLTIFSHETFDPALQPGCMSSEESCDEYVEEVYPSGLLSKVQVLRIRGMAWRSTRLLRFYALLDAEEEAAAEQMLQQRVSNNKPRRPLARKERCIGPPKDGFVLPPQGVATWMISRRWIKENRDTHPDLEDLLRGLVSDPSGFDWSGFDALGEQSEEEGQEQDASEQQLIPRSDTSSSLAHALPSPA